MRAVTIPAFTFVQYIKANGMRCKGFWAFVVVIFFTSCLKDDSAGLTDGSGFFTKIEDVVYGVAENAAGDQESLTLDVYVPDHSSQANPLVVLIHGGGFYSGDKGELQRYCAYLAKRNITAVTIDYRLGWSTGDENDFCAGDVNSMILAGYRAIQDTRAAMRYLMANTVKYNIDPQKVFIGGQSAGAVAALATAFMSQDEANTFFPGAQELLGGINEGGNTLKNGFMIRGVINMWGGVLHPSVIDVEERIPVISFHGDHDPVVPYEIGHFASCENFPVLYGAKAVYEVLTDQQVGTVLHTEVGGGHGVYDVEYIAGNSYCFIQSVLENKKINKAYTHHRSNCP